MASTRHSWVGLFGAVGMVGFSVTSCTSAPPSTYDQGSDEPTGSVAEAVSGAVGNWAGYTDGQCVTGAYHFFETRFGASFVGLCAQGANVGNCENCGACMIWQGSRVEPNPAVWDRHPWGSVMPQLYDMVVYPAAGGAFGYGHVAVVDHMTSSNPSAYQTMYVMDSNWYGNQKMATAVHTVPRVPYGIYRLKSLSNVVTNAAPKGYLDAVSCTTLGGWAQDTTVATKAINTDVYFDGPAGTPGAESIRLDADQARPDLCTPLGSCNHAWSMATPRGAMDGKPHKVYAYGIDSAGGPNTLLANSPMSFTCAAPPIAKTSVKRAIPGMNIVNDWKLSTFFDMAAYTDAEVAAVANGPAFDAPPSLEQVKGTPDIFVVDGKERRHVTGTASFDAWRFTSAMVKTVTAAELAALSPGLDWPAAPLLVKGTSATVYMLDITVASPPTPGGGTSGGSTPSSPGAGSTTGNDGTDTGNASSDDSGSSGCSVSQTTTRTGNGAMWLLAAMGGLALAQKRRSSSRR